MTFKKILTSGWFAILLIFLIGLGVRGYKIQDKGGYFVDEYLTILLSNYGDKGWSEEVADDGAYYTGEELKSMLYGGDNSLSGVTSDIEKLRETTRDPHPNLYYSFFKLSLLGIDSGDLNSVTSRGFILNLFFFIISFWFLYLLAKLLFPDQTLLICCSLAVAYLCGVSVENTMFFRPYQMQETLFVIFSYLFVKNVLDVQQGKNILKLSNLLYLSFATALFLLSGYFSIPYVVLLGLILIGYFIKTKVSVKHYVFILLTLVLAAAIIYLVYPSYTDNIFNHHRGSEVMSSFDAQDLFNNIRESFIGLSRQVKANYIGIPLAIFVTLVVAFALYKYKTHKGNNTNDIAIHRGLTTVLIVCAFLWLLLVFYVAPFKVMRYGAPAFPVLSLGIPLLCSFFQRRERVILVVAFSLLFFLKTLTIKELYWERRIPDEKYESNTHIPLIIAGVEHPWMQVGLTPFFTDARKIQITLDPANFRKEINSYDSVYVFIYKDNYNWDIYRKELENHNIVGDILNGDIGWFYRGFLLEKKKP